MSVRRLVATAAAMAGVAALLSGVAPTPVAAVADLAAPQLLLRTDGPEALLVAVAAVLAWAVWAWGALGLLLAGAGALPGATGALARLAQRVLIPAAGRRAAAVLLGVGVGLTGPGAVAFAAGPTQTPVPDWPAATVPDWPTAQPAEVHVVAHGECLWRITGGWLRERAGRAPTNAEIATGVSAWWQTNAAVIGSDPDRLLPGQVLRPPEGA